jgi:hypothetical protein
MHTKTMALLTVTGAILLSITSFTFAADVHSWKGGSGHVESFGGKISYPQTGGYYNNGLYNVSDDDEESSKKQRKPRIGAGAIDPETGKYYPPIPGGVIDPDTGEFFPSIPGGVINPDTGEFFPSVR